MSRSQSTTEDPVEYVVVGAGPAAICAVAKLYHAGVSGNQILWVDPQFQVGDFGSKLSKGSSVPGNTSVASYQRVNHAIYSMISACDPNEKISFELTNLAADLVCPIKIAAHPLQYISDQLCQLVHTLRGSVAAINETNKGLSVTIKQLNGPMLHLQSKRVILAIGATPKTLSLPSQITLIQPEIAFIESELAHYLKENPNINTVAVIGSSHSAALASMHLLKAGIQVKQFMNKEYKFATPAVTATGIEYTQFDNTGLKGDVAKFTRQLLHNVNTKSGVNTTQWTCHIGRSSNEMLNEFTHAVVCIGYHPNNSLHINEMPLSEYQHDKTNTQIMTRTNQIIRGVFGIGIAFPLEVRSISGEIEFAVGVGKFWATLEEQILSHWEHHPAQTHSALS